MQRRFLRARIPGLTLAASALVTAGTLAALAIMPAVASAHPVGPPTAVEHLTDQPDYSTGAYPWALDDYTFQGYVNGTQTTYYEHGTFTAKADPETGDALSSPVHGSFEGTLVYDSTFPSGCGGCIPYSIDFTYRAPKGWVFTENQPAGDSYTQSENFSLEDAIP